MVDDDLGLDVNGEVGAKALTCSAMSRARTVVVANFIVCIYK